MADLFDIVVARKLSGGGGSGGGDSDFHKTTITLGVTGGEGYQNSYFIMLLDAFSETANQSGVHFTFEDSVRYISTDGFNRDVSYPTTESVEVNIVNESRVIVSTGNTSEVYAVTGDAEVATVEVSGESYNIVYVYGDCTITTVGSPY